MKGLFLKDFALLKMQKTYMLLLMGIAVLGVFTMNNPAFAAGYLAFLSPILAIGTVSYDTFDNGSAFLFSLPVTRRQYVQEKYLLSLGLEAVGLGLGVAVCLAAGMGREGLMATPFIYGGGAVMVSVMLPLQLKYGAEKSRIATAAVLGTMVVLGYGLSRLAGKAALTALLERLAAVPAEAWMLGTLALAGGIAWLSFWLSLRILEKKEF